MTSSFKPLLEVMRELRALAQKKASGYFFIVTEENHSCIVRLAGGDFADVTFRMLRNDEAVQRLAMVGAARGRFQADPAASASTGNANSNLSDAARQWLLGGFENDAALAASPTAKAPGAVPSAGSGIVLARQREVIEKISLNYFGPIASLLCEEAFEASSDIGQILEQIAANLPTPAETQRFLKEARAALAVVR